MPTVCILYGLAEGPRLSKKLVASLTAAGFEAVTDAAKADALLVHSGGYHLIPQDVANKTVLLVAPSNGYKGQSLFLTQLQKLDLDLRYCLINGRLGWWTYKSFWQTVYLLTRHRPYHLTMLRGAQRLGKTLPVFNAKRLGIVLHKDDPWSWHLDAAELVEKQQATFISHPGIHDDLWMHPQEYISVLQYLHET